MIIRVLDLLPLFLRIHVVDHANVDIVGLQPFQQILEGRAHVAHVPRPVILLILPGSADMALDVPLLPRFSLMPSPMIFLDFGSGIQQSRILIPFDDA